MNKKRRGRKSKYTDAFKRQMVAESHAAGATVPLISNQHGVPTSRIYSWRGDARFRSTEVETLGFTPIEGSDAPKIGDIDHLLPGARIEITLEKANRYALTRLPKARPYLDHGVLELDNDTTGPPRPACPWGPLENF